MRVIIVPGFDFGQKTIPLVVNKDYQYSVSAFGTQQYCRLSHLLVCLSVWKAYSGKTADWIRMPFRVVSGSVEGWVYYMGVMIVEREGADLG